MTTTEHPTGTVPLPREHIEELADELLRALTPHAGDPAAVSRVLDRWLDVLDVGVLGLVCVRATFRTFSSCLTRVPVDDAPPGALTLNPPPDEEAT